MSRPTHLCDDGGASLRRFVYLLVSVVTIAALSTAARGQVVEVGAGQTLTPESLATGSFGGVNFTLNSNVTFAINQGGLVGPPFNEFDFNGANVNVNNGGRITTRLAIGNADVTVIGGGVIDPEVRLSAGTTLSVQAGSVGRGLRIDGGAELRVLGGEVKGDVAEPISVDAGGNAVIEGGDVGLFDNEGSVVVAGGEVSRIISRGFSDARVDLLGGVVNDVTAIYSGSVLEVDGGAAYRVQASEGAKATIRSGPVNSVHSGSGADVTLVGGEFLLNGTPYSDASVEIGEADIFTGTLSDGSPFVLSPGGLVGASTNSGAQIQLLGASLPEIDMAPIIVDATGGVASSGLRAGQILTLKDGGEISAPFASVGGRLHVQGGLVDSSVRLVDSELSIENGTVRSVHAYEGTNVRVSGGRLSSMYAGPGATLEVVGREFSINGVPIEPASLNDSQELLEQFDPQFFFELSGVLSDGSPFNMGVTDWISSVQNQFLPGSSLSVIFVPEPSVSLLSVQVLFFGVVGLQVRPRRCEYDFY